GDPHERRHLGDGQELHPRQVPLGARRPAHDLTPRGCRRPARQAFHQHRTVTDGIYATFRAIWSARAACGPGSACGPGRLGPGLTRTRAHSDRSATTGSSLPARCAGTTPAATPTATETPNARATDHQVTTAGTGDVAATTSAAATPNPSPATPPTPVSSTASSRNCTAMSRGRAPTALRRPISRNRSRTDTSTMLATPT